MLKQTDTQIMSEIGGMGENLDVTKGFLVKYFTNLPWWKNIKAFKWPYT